MFPVAPLPNSPFTLAELASCAEYIGRKAARETALDQAPAHSKVCISGRQRPDGMEVIRQHANRNCFKRIALLRGHIHSPQSVNVTNQQIARPVGKREGE